MSWKRVQLAEVCNITMGQAPVGSSYNEENTGYALIAGAGDFGESTPTPKKFTTAASKISGVGDLILCIRATIGDLNWSDKQYCLGRGVAGLAPKNNLLDKNYLWHFISSNKQQLSSLGTGSTFKQINSTHIKEFEIPLPPLAEQKRIAAILDKADTIRRKRQQTIQLADNFLRSVFLDMFGDPVTNPKGWKLAPIKDFATVTTGNTPSRKKTEYYGCDVEWIKSDNINTPHHIVTTATEYLSKSGLKVSRTAPKGSTLITCIAGSFDCIGNCAYTDREVSFNQQINALTPKGNVSGWFLYALILYSKKSIQNASTNSMKGMISKGKLQEVELILPPVEHQKKYEIILDRQLKLNERLTVSLQKTGYSFNSISQKAFSGQL